MCRIVQFSLDFKQRLSQSRLSLGALEEPSDWENFILRGRNYQLLIPAVLQSPEILDLVPHLRH